MKKFLKAVFHPGKTNWFWLYYVLGAIFLLFAIWLMPVWPSDWTWCFWRNWGQGLVNIVVAVLILLYVIFILCRKVRKYTNKPMKVIAFIEIFLMIAVAITSVLQQFKIVDLGGACAIAGLAIWLRGVVEVFRAYYYHSDSTEKYPVWMLMLAILALTAGTVLIHKPFIQDVAVIWIFDVIIYLCAITMIVDGILAKPEKVK